MILVGILFLVPTLASIVLRIPEVQTYMVNRITGHFSERIKSTISVGRVEYTFFNKLVLSDLLIKDQNSDTLLWSSQDFRRHFKARYSRKEYPSWPC